LLNFLLVKECAEAARVSGVGQSATAEPGGGGEGGNTINPQLDWTTEAKTN
jgi:hypothetical protein